ncbi:MAG: hypothetical protein ACREE9_04485 [Stellaceae bacterium]
MGSQAPQTAMSGRSRPSHDQLARGPGYFLLARIASADYRERSGFPRGVDAARLAAFGRPATCAPDVLRPREACIAPAAAPLGWPVLKTQNSLKGS